MISVEQRASARVYWAGVQAREEQIEPEGDWNTWLIQSGRGWGKTRTGAEWIVWQAVNNPNTRWAVVAPTYSDVRDTCIEGVSGIRAVLDRYRMSGNWNRSLGEVILKNGSRIKLFSADQPERLRGPQHHGAWVDELAAWRYMEEAWNQLKFGLRLGEHPKIVATTTPKPSKFLKALQDNPTTIVTRGSTFDNAANLSGEALKELKLRYEGSRMGRQELYGELIEDVEGALWTAKNLDETRVIKAPEMERIVVGVDPAVSFTEDSDATGIITVGKGVDGEFYVLADHTIKGTPDQWARQVAIAFYAAKADHIVIEVNQGGDLNESVLRTIDPDLPIRKVHATRGKRIRAEPVSALSEQFRVHLCGYFQDLEDELTQWSPESSDSPDRLDAFVWGMTALMQGRTIPIAQRVFQTLWAIIGT